MTPKGACSITARPWSPLKTSLREELHAQRPLAQRLELLDLVLQPADLGLFHLHRAQLDALLDGDAADVADDAAAVFQGHGREALEGLAGGGHRGVDRGEQPVAALAAVGSASRGAGGPQPRQHLLNDVANQGFVDLHGERLLGWPSSRRHSRGRRGPCR